MKSLVLLFFALFPISFLAQVYSCNDGVAKFKSEAKLEVIKAESNKVSGALDAGSGNFAFAVAMNSFEGFNSELQKEHFNENYVESAQYPMGTFKGKIVEQVNLNQDGTYSVKAKGILDIHGVQQERTMDATVIVKNKEIEITSDFEVGLSDHKIKIPKVVNQNLATTISVNFHAVLRPKS